MGADSFRDAEVNAIAHEIERYAATHPRSKDSLEGICHWWLGNRSMSVSPRTVQHAIDDLVRRGVLTEETLPDGGRIYACKRRAQRGDPDDDA